MTRIPHIFRPPTIAVWVVAAMTALGGARALPLAPAAGGFAQASPGDHPASAEETSRLLEAQVLLAFHCFSPGEVDGIEGSNTERALRAFQRARGLEVTGTADDATLEALREGSPGDALVERVLTADDLSDVLLEAIPEDTMEKAALETLGFTSRLEALGERFHVEPALLEELNPGASLEEGATLVVPALGAAAKGGCAAGELPVREEGDLKIEVSAAEGALRLLDGGELVFYAPVTAGSERDPLPEGEWSVRGSAHDPPFEYDPELFWDAEPGDEKATLPPGPNNPVGRVWIDIDAEHYGLHGTPEPGTVGHAESHGCVRLTNWDALSLAAVVGPGTAVIFRTE